MNLDQLRSSFPWPSERPPLPVDLGPVWYLDDELIGHTGPIRSVVSKGSQIVLELGSFCGRSTTSFLQICPGATVIAVDTWAGSSEHETNSELKALLPRLYDQFLTNLWDYRSRVIPVRENTQDGMNLISACGIKPDWIYVDADHAEDSVVADVITAVRLFPDAQIVGDDYLWPSVQAAVTKVSAQLGCQVGVIGAVWWFKK